jgi:hypothetical protein
MEVIVCTDAACVRHCERQACSGFCTCRPDMLRMIPSKPKDTAGMKLLLKNCTTLPLHSRMVRTHRPKPGQTECEPCDAPGCTFAHHDPVGDLAASLALEAPLLADVTPKGVRKYADFRMGHAATHGNVQVGEYGQPLIHHNMVNQVPEPLHGLKLNLLKVGDKHAYLNHMSDPARESCSDYMTYIKHPLDTRRKESCKGHRGEKWHNGEALGSLIDGHRGSPGGAIVYAEKALIISADLLAGESPSASLATAEPTAKPTPPAPPKKKGGLGRNAFTSAGLGGSTSTRDAPPPAPAVLPHIPTAMERQADPEAIAYIRQVMGGHAQLIINSLLVADAFITAYRVIMKPMVFLSDDVEVKEKHAFDVMCAMIDYSEILERVAIRRHKSWYPHLGVYRWTQWILDRGDLWAVHMSALELLNAETKRTAENNGSKCLEHRASGLTQIGPKTVGKLGPVALIQTKGYNGSLSESTFTHMAVKQLRRRRGEGIRTRVAERLFGVLRTGRATLARFGQKHCMDADIDPRTDTAICAWVRICKRRIVSGDLTWHADKVGAN